MASKQTQGDILAAILKQGPTTYLEMNLAGVSVAPHMRIIEYCRKHPEWEIAKGQRDGNTTWRLVRAERSL